MPEPYKTPTSKQSNKMQFRKFTKRAIAVLILILILSAAAWAWYAACGGVSHKEIKDAVQESAKRVEGHIDLRCDTMERKLDRIESKLDRLIELATPKLPDNMIPAE